MADKNIVKAVKATRRRARVRGKISGTPDCPRLTVCKSLNNMFVQIIDDVQGHTLLSLSSNSKDIKADLDGKKKTDAAKVVGEKIGHLAKEKGIESVVFDRNSNRYHGRVKAVADGVRKSGLKF